MSLGSFLKDAGRVLANPRNHLTDMLKAVRLNRVTVEALRARVTVVLPTLDEEEAIGPLLAEVQKAGYQNILVVDGRSSDSTVKIASEQGAKVLQQSGTGKAGALLTAFHNLPTQTCVVMDGDGSYDPNDLDKFLPFVGDFGLVKGDRGRKENMSRLHRLGNSIITWQFNVLFRTKIADVCSGMYLIDVTRMGNLELEKHPMAAEQEITAQAVSKRVPMASVPIGYRRRRGGRSKTHTWRQGFRDVWTNFDLAWSYHRTNQPSDDGAAPSGAPTSRTRLLGARRTPCPRSGTSR